MAVIGAANPGSTPMLQSELRAFLAFPAFHPESDLFVAPSGSGAAFNDAFSVYWGGMMGMSRAFWAQYVREPAFKPEISLVAWAGEQKEILARGQGSGAR